MSTSTSVTLSAKLREQIAIILEGLAMPGELLSEVTAVIKAGSGVNPATITVCTRVSLTANTLLDAPAAAHLFRQLIDDGTRFFDACLFLALPPPARTRVTFKPARDTSAIDPVAVQKAVQAAYFLYHRSDKVYIRMNEVTPNVFRLCGLPTLTRVMFNELLSTVDPEVFPLSLLRGLDIKLMEPKLAHALGLGFAGLRQLAFVYKYNPDSPAFSAVQQRVLSLRAFYTFVRETGFHSSRRPDAFISVFGSLNRYVDVLILAAYTPGLLRAAVDSRFLYCIPLATDPTVPDDPFTEANLKAVGFMDEDGSSGASGDISFTPSQWRQTLKEEEKRLVYSDAEKIIVQALAAHGTSRGYVPKNRQGVNFEKTSKDVQPVELYKALEEAEAERMAEEKRWREEDEEYTA